MWWMRRDELLIAAVALGLAIALAIKWYDALNPVVPSPQPPCAKCEKIGK